MGGWNSSLSNFVVEISRSANWLKSNWLICLKLRRGIWVLVFSLKKNLSFNLKDFWSIFILIIIILQSNNECNNSNNFKGTCLLWVIHIVLKLQRRDVFLWEAFSKLLKSSSNEFMMFWCKFFINFLLIFDKTWKEERNKIKSWNLIIFEVWGVIIRHWVLFLPIIKD